MHNKHNLSQSRRVKMYLFKCSTFASVIIIAALIKCMEATVQIKVLLYEDVDYEGRSLRLTEYDAENGCYNLPEDFRNTTSSAQMVRGTEMIVMYSGLDCNGNLMQLYSSLNNMNKMRFDDQLQSIKFNAIN